jgi:hypothetical protein
MDANFQRVPSINSFTLLMNGTHFTTVSFSEFYSCSFAVSRVKEKLSRVVFSSVGPISPSGKLDSSGIARRAQSADQSVYEESLGLARF